LLCYNCFHIDICGRFTCTCCCFHWSNTFVWVSGRA